MRPSVKERALRALRNCLVEDETGKLHRGKAQLEWCPVRAGTVKGTLGPIPVHDDANGHLRTQLDAAVADINYQTGEIELEPWFRLFSHAGFKVSYSMIAEKGPPPEPVHTEQEPEFVCRLLSTLNKKYYKKVVIRGKPN